MYMKSWRRTIGDRQLKSPLPIGLFSCRQDLRGVTELQPLSSNLLNARTVTGLVRWQQAQVAPARSARVVKQHHLFSSHPQRRIGSCIHHLGVSRIS